MKKKLLFLYTLLLCAGSLQAQKAKDYFLSMPDSLTPLLTEVNKADCIDFLESKMKAEVTNRFGKKSQMTHLSPSYIRMQMTSKSTWQLKVLPVNDTLNLICTVSTVYGPVPDSQIRFYDEGWKELPASSFLEEPDISTFLPVSDDSGQDYKIRDAVRQADMALMVADLTAEGDTLRLTLTTPRYMDKETAKTLQPYLRRSVDFVWKEKCFRPVTSL